LQFIHSQGEVLLLWGQQVIKDHSGFLMGEQVAKHVKQGGAVGCDSHFPSSQLNHWLLPDAVSCRADIPPKHA